jgi:hypothetical protein
MHMCFLLSSSLAGLKRHLIVGHKDRPKECLFKDCQSSFTKWASFKVNNYGNYLCRSLMLYLFGFKFEGNVHIASLIAGKIFL